MASIMTAIRNCMNVITLDACMQIASNCPRFDNLDASRDPEIMSIVEEAFQHWQLSLQRYPARSNGRQGRKAKNKSQPLADVFEQQAKAARKASGGDLLLEDSDSSEDENASDDDQSEAGAAVADFSNVGDFVVPDGWVVLDPPSLNEAEWSTMKKSFKWQNKKLAHIWDEPTGWQLASFSSWDKGERMCCFYYPSDGQKVTHGLPLDEYGIDGHWVILERKK
jgi:hypothetical protein